MTLGVESETFRNVTLVGVGRIIWRVRSGVTLGVMSVTLRVRSVTLGVRSVTLGVSGRNDEGITGNVAVKIR